MNGDVTAGLAETGYCRKGAWWYTVETVTCEKSMAEYFRWAQIKAWTNLGSESVSLLETPEEEPGSEIQTAF